MGIPAVRKLHAAALLFFAVASQLPARAQSEPALSRSSGTERELIEAARARHQAYAHHDCLDWASYVSADFHFIDQAGHSFTRDQEMKECQPQPADAGSRHAPSSSHQFLGVWSTPGSASVEDRPIIS